LGLQETEFGELLPLSALKNVKELTICCEGATKEEPLWPSTWGQLTNMTSLRMDCRNNEYQSYLPDFVTNLRSLKTLKATTSFQRFGKSGYAFMEHAASTLTQLTRLQMDIDERSQLGEDLP